MSKRFAVFAVVSAFILFVALAFVYFVLPHLLVDEGGLTANEKAQRLNEARTTGLQGLAGAVLAAGGVFTAYSVLSNREGQLDERFARAVQLLAGDDPYVIRGAIYSLERIAVQSIFDRSAVVEVLAGYLRDQSPVGQSTVAKDPSPEVADALSVLCRAKALRGSPVPRIHDTDLRKMRLAKLDLRGALLTGSDLSEADLTDTDLRQADLTGAKLISAVAVGTDMREAELIDADLTGVPLVDAKLSNANLRGATLKDALINSQTELIDTEFRAAKLDGMMISDADLSQARMRRARCSGATYSERTRVRENFDPEYFGMKLDPEMGIFLR